MFRLTGKAKGSGLPVVALGFTGAELAGMRNSQMLTTLDGVRGPPLELGGVAFIFIGRADSAEQLARSVGHFVEVETSAPMTPGIIEEPKGGDN